MARELADRFVRPFRHAVAIQLVLIERVIVIPCQVLLPGLRQKTDGLVLVKPIHRGPGVYGGCPPTADNCRGLDEHLEHRGTSPKASSARAQRDDCSSRTRSRRRRLGVRPVRAAERQLTPAARDGTTTRISAAMRCGKPMPSSSSNNSSRRRSPRGKPSALSEGEIARSTEVADLSRAPSLGGQVTGPALCCADGTHTVKSPLLHHRSKSACQTSLSSESTSSMRKTRLPKPLGEVPTLSPPSGQR